MLKKKTDSIATFVPIKTHPHRSWFLNKNGKIYNNLKSAKKPVFIIGESGLSSNGEYVLETVKKILKDNNFLNNDWNGLNILHQNASSVGAIYLNLLKSTGNTSCSL